MMDSLDLRDRYVCGAVNSTWLRASALVTSVVDVSENQWISAVVVSVGRRFPRMRGFELRFDDDYFTAGRPILTGAQLARCLGGAPQCDQVRLVFPKNRRAAVDLLLTDDVSSVDLLTDDVIAAMPDSLTVLSLSYVTVRSLDALIRGLTRWRYTLRVLELVDHIYNAAVVDAIAVVVPGLEILDLNCWFLFDDDIRRLFGGGASRLRRLTVAAQVGNRGGMGVLTDTAMEVIATACPILQYLDVRFHHGITARGLGAILRGCPIRDLTTTDTGVAPRDLADLVVLCPTLLILRAGHGCFVGAYDRCHRVAAHVHYFDVMEGLILPPPLPTFLANRRRRIAT